MVNLIAIRGLGDKPGDDIVDALISTVPVALNRARNEFDSLADKKVLVNYEGPHQTGLTQGMLAEIRDQAFGVDNKAVVTSIRHRGTYLEHTTVLRLERNA